MCADSHVMLFLSFLSAVLHDRSQCLLKPSPLFQTPRSNISVGTENASHCSTDTRTESRWDTRSSLAEMETFTKQDFWILVIWFIDKQTPFHFFNLFFFFLPTKPLPASEWVNEREKSKHETFHRPERNEEKHSDDACVSCDQPDDHSIMWRRTVAFWDRSSRLAALMLRSGSADIRDITD